MADRGKVIEGLECIMRSKPEDCVKVCGGAYKCAPAVARDAVELLREPEQRVMTLGEIFTAQKTDTWYETRNEEAIHPLMLVETENSIKHQCAYFWPGIVAPIKGYGKTWRCWTARPTDERKKAVKWGV